MLHWSLTKIYIITIFAEWTFLQLHFYSRKKSYLYKNFQCKVIRLRKGWLLLLTAQLPELCYQCINGCVYMYATTYLTARWDFFHSCMYEMLENKDFSLIGSHATSILVFNPKSFRMDDNLILLVNTDHV